MHRGGCFQGVRSENEVGSDCSGPGKGPWLLGTEQTVVLLEAVFKGLSGARDVECVRGAGMS